MSGGRRPSDIYPVIIEHLRRIRFVPGCQNSTIVIVPESNLGFEALHIEDYIREAFGPPRPGNYVVMKEDDTRAGIKTNEDIKLAMTTSLDRVLRHHAMHFHRNFFSVGELVVNEVATNGSAAASDAQTPSSASQLPDDDLRIVTSADTMRDSIVTQLSSWMRIVQPRKDPNDDRPPRIFHTGKRGYKVDDNTIALSLANMFAKRFHSSNEYREYHNNRV